MFIQRLTYLGVTAIFSDHTEYETNIRRRIRTTENMTCATALCISSTYTQAV